MKVGGGPGRSHRAGSGTTTNAKHHEYSRNTFMCAQDSQTDHLPRRRILTSLTTLSAGLMLAGCSTEDVNPPEQVTDSTAPEATGGNGEGGADSGSDGGANDGSGGPTSAEPTANEPETTNGALGDVIEGDNLALVAYGVERTTAIGDYINADEGSEFVLVDIAAKNKSDDEYIRFSSFFQLTLRDSEAYEYDQEITGADNSLEGGELVPGEVTRGVVVFEVPTDATGLSLHINLDESLFQYTGATIDLESRGSGRTLTQDLMVEVYDVRDTLEYDDVRFTPNEVRTEMGEQYAEPDPGNEFVIVDITVENLGGDELTVSTLLQMQLKDVEGRTYDTSITALTTLERGFTQGNPIPPNGKRRGEIAFEAEQGLSPLYLLMDFDLFAEGDKTFYRLR